MRYQIVSQTGLYTVQIITTPSTYHVNLDWARMDTVEHIRLACWQDVLTFSTYEQAKRWVEERR